jgi:hydroxymethylbilane synthase
MTRSRELVIGTRGSALALTQSEWVAAAIRGAHPHLAVRLERIRTSGDRLSEDPLGPAGGKGLFVKEIEEALLDGRIDLAVHSLKDVPADLPAGLTLGAFPRREDARDVLVTRTGATLDALPEGATLGTGSLRRQAQLLDLRPDLKVVPLRGNVDTRLRKLDAGDVDAIVLAAAGLRRLGLDARITEFLPPERLLPAIGQGALAIELRERDLAADVGAAVRHLDHAETRAAVLAERAFLRRLGGDCQTPVAAHAGIAAGRLALRAVVASTDGARVVRGEAGGDVSRAEALGAGLAEDLLGRGARAILDALRAR